VNFYYYAGERRKAAIKAYIKAVKTHHVTGKAALLAEKYVSESRYTD
jgi:hypothetical protein